MTASGVIRFPCDQIPESVPAAKLMGIYEQRQEGLFFQRVKTRSGAITLAQWRGLAELVRQYTPDFAIHITTRQDIEIHGLSADQVPRIQKEIFQLGLTGQATCGAGVRIITTCPHEGFIAGTWHVAELVAAIAEHVTSLPWGHDLPKKFKSSISCCSEGAARPWLNDLGVLPNDDGTFRAVVAGSLGKKPMLAMPMYESLTGDELFPLFSAVLRMYHTYGDREHKIKFRLRHVREQMGDESFCQLLDELFQEEKSRDDLPKMEITRVETDIPMQAHLSLPHGNITPDQAIELADAAEAAGAELRLGLSHDLYLFGNQPVQLNSVVHQWSEITTVVACPGATWCSHGITETFSTAEQIRGILPSGFDLSIAISGCPNNCGHSPVADIGLVGRVKKIDDVRVDCYRLFAGGGLGQTPTLARKLHEAVPAKQIDSVIRLLWEEYEAASTQESLTFAEFIAASQEELAGKIEQHCG